MDVSSDRQAAGKVHAFCHGGRRPRLPPIRKCASAGDPCSSAAAVLPGQCRSAMLQERPPRVVPWSPERNDDPTSHDPAGHGPARPAAAPPARRAPAAVATAPAATTGQASSYFDNTGRDDVLSGGVRMIQIDTPKGKFRVWTKRTGNNPTIKVLLLHGGPGATHEAFEAFDSYFPGRRHRVLLLRPARLRLQRPAARPLAVGYRPLRRRSRAGARTRSSSDPTTSTCTGSPGAASWPSNTRSSTRTS